MRKIGILEDDEALGRELTYFLTSNGYESRLIAPSEYEGKRADELIKLLVDENLHLLLLDIGLPGVDGLHVCKQFRATSEVPVIMITSKNDELTELMAINNGADDFVAKPFNPQILIAHMESVLRRTYKEQVASDELMISQTVTDADGNEVNQSFTFEVLKGRITNGDMVANLSKNEIQILRVLSKRQGEIVSRDDIINALKALSESIDSTGRYEILKKIGSDHKMLRKALFAQIAVYFTLPLVVAIIHSIFGMRFAEFAMSAFLSGSTFWGICVTAAIMAVLYGGYMLATYRTSKRIVEIEG